MKKVVLFAAFVLLGGIGINAQSDAKSCNKPCSHSEKASAEVSSDASKALMAANNDENIEVKTCEESGKVSFYRKDVCENSGKVSFTEVEYQEGNGSFAVKASNDEKMNEAPAKKSDASCSSKSAKSSCSSTSAKSGCCSSKASTASAKSSKCCSGSKSTCSSKS